jgi:archaellum component FlaC
LAQAEDDIQKRDEEIKRLTEEKDELKRNYARLVQKFNADKAPGAEQLRASMRNTEQAVAKNQRLENQVS